MTVNLANEFSNMGHIVEIVLSKAEGPYLSLVNSSVNVVNLGSDRVLTSLFPLMFYLKKFKPDIVLSAIEHANLAAIVSNIMAGNISCVYIGIHTTVSKDLLKDKFFRRKIFSIAMKILYPIAKGIIAVSDGVKKDLEKVLDNNNVKINVIYNPVITPEILELSEEPCHHQWFNQKKIPVILGVGRLSKEKDFQRLIKACHLIMKKYNIYLVILGEGEERKSLEALVGQLGICNFVWLPGFVQNPYPYLRRASVFVLSSQYEGLPTVLIEALAVGTPVVSTDCPNGPREILEGGKFGELVTLENVESLACSIEKAITKERVKVNEDDLKKYSSGCAALNYLKVFEEK